MCAALPSLRVRVSRLGQRFDSTLASVASCNFLRCVGCWWLFSFFLFSLSFFLIDVLIVLCIRAKVVRVLYMHA